jgi:putative membrane protein
MRRLFANRLIRHGSRWVLMAIVCAAHDRIGRSRDRLLRPAAIPEDFWMRWNSDPLPAFAALAFAVARGQSANARAGWAAMALMFVIFVSPLCALASALFSARVFNMSRWSPPWHRFWRWFSDAPWVPAALAVPVATQAVVLWLWHAPGSTSTSRAPAYWLMQGSAGSAWLRAGDPGARRSPPRPHCTAATIGQWGLGR